jgi:lipid-A-disaccharide synthase
VVCYKGSALSIWLAKKLVKIKYISLVNLILDRSAVPELIQEDCTASNMQRALRELLPGEAKRQAQLSSYAELHELLQHSGTSERIAKSMNAYLES